MITPNDFKNGLTLEIDGEVYLIIEYQPVKPGKGTAFTRTRLKNLRSKKIIDRTYRVDERFQEAFVEEKRLQYLYNNGTHYHFMDQGTYEEQEIAREHLEDVIKYLKENMELTAVVYKSEVIDVHLPIFIEASVIHTEPGVKGDTAKGSFKPATIETGATVQVPLFINENDRIKIDTRTGDYVERISS
ncbi:MAG: elongation factor P [Candidatus Omnitrophica bacterium]|nr:elongation factor P [Candidatus Omnitrophota bacterium]